jgi:diguanylate cyclase (GGDEF)-like protein
VVDEDAAESLVVDRIAIPRGTAGHEPLISGGETTGVLSVLWPGLLEDPERPRSLIGLLGHHAATALERADLLRRLRQAARTDALTGTANRRVWQESLDRELMRAGRAHQPLSVVLIDLDNFKAYNDRHGHPQGDRLLQDAAVAWAGQLRAADLLARMGGEEFAVMLPDTDLDGALVVAERLRASVPDGQTCSIGVVACESPATSSELYSTADAALYRAKQAGRNRIEVGVLAGLSAEPL